MTSRSPKQTSEDLDPRIQFELEKLNKASNDINKLELELERVRGNFRQILTGSTQQLNALTKNLGTSIEKARPYYEARIKAKEAQLETQNAALRFERACGQLAAAKETVTVAEEGFFKKGQAFDPAWQEMLNHATMKVNEAEKERLESELEHQATAAAFNEEELNVKELYRELKKAIQKSKPYFELKARFTQAMQEQKSRANTLENAIVLAKHNYSQTLRNLEKISDEIHLSRQEAKIRQEMGSRGSGVGAECPHPSVGAEAPGQVYKADEAPHLIRDIVPAKCPGGSRVSSASSSQEPHENVGISKDQTESTCETIKSKISESSDRAPESEKLRTQRSAQVLDRRPSYEEAIEQGPSDGVLLRSSLLRQRLRHKVRSNQQLQHPSFTSKSGKSDPPFKIRTKNSGVKYSSAMSNESGQRSEEVKDMKPAAPEARGIANGMEDKTAVDLTKVNTESVHKEAVNSAHSHKRSNIAGARFEGKEGNASRTVAPESKTVFSLLSNLRLKVKKANSESYSNEKPNVAKPEKSEDSANIKGSKMSDNNGSVTQHLVAHSENDKEKSFLVNETVTEKYGKDKSKLSTGLSTFTADLTEPTLVEQNQQSNGPALSCHSNVSASEEIRETTPGIAAKHKPSDRHSDTPLSLTSGDPSVKGNSLPSLCITTPRNVGSHSLNTASENITIPSECVTVTSQLNSSHEYDNPVYESISGVRGFAQNNNSMVSGERLVVTSDADTVKLEENDGENDDGMLFPAPCEEEASDSGSLCESMASGNLLDDDQIQRAITDFEDATTIDEAMTYVSHDDPLEDDVDESEYCDVIDYKTLPNRLSYLQEYVTAGSLLGEQLSDVDAEIVDSDGSSTDLNVK